MCGKEPLQRNPYLVDIRFQRDLNLSLPLYNGLNYVGGSILTVSYTHPPSPRDLSTSRMPSSA